MLALRKVVGERKTGMSDTLTAAKTAIELVGKVAHAKIDEKNRRIEALERELAEAKEALRNQVKRNIEMYAEHSPCPRSWFDFGRIYLQLTSMKKIFCPDTGEIAKSYASYLETDHWKKIKEALSEATGGICQSCKQFKPPLEIHHKHYDSLGGEKFADLMIICRDCHQKIHEASKPNKNYRHASLGHSCRGVLIPLCCWESKKQPTIYAKLLFAKQKQSIACPTCRARFKRHVKKCFSSGKVPLRLKTVPSKNLMIDFF